MKNKGNKRTKKILTWIAIGLAIIILLLLIIKIFNIHLIKNIFDSATQSHADEAIKSNINNLLSGSK